jgi:hypothetical protein
VPTSPSFPTITGSEFAERIWTFGIWSDVSVVPRELTLE